MAYTVAENTLIGQAFGDVSTTAKAQLGQVVRAKDQSVTGIKHATFVYFKASAAIVQYSAIWIKGASGFGAMLSDTNSKSAGQPGFAQIAFAADEYGWAMQNGLPIVRLKPTTEGNTALYVNASVGTLTGVTASTQILGVVALTSVTTTVGAVTCVSKFPVVLRAASATMT